MSRKQYKRARGRPRRSKLPQVEPSAEGAGQPAMSRPQSKKGRRGSAHDHFSKSDGNAFDDTDARQARPAKGTDDVDESAYFWYSEAFKTSVWTPPWDMKKSEAV